MNASFRNLALLTAALALLPAAAHAALYKHVDASGNVTYDSNPPTPEEAQGRAGSTGQLEIPEEVLKDPVKGAGLVVGYSGSMLRTADFCIASVPSSAARVKAARQHWEAANSKLVEKSWALLRARLPTSDLKYMNATVDSALQRLSAGLNNLPPDQQKKLCDALPDRYNAPASNLTTNRQLVDSIMNAK